MQTRTVIIHGWSDTADSFKEVRRHLAANGIAPVTDIYFGEYESREDYVTYNDVSDGLFDEFVRLGFVDADGNKLCDLNVICHSTGGLVIRHFINCNYCKAGTLSPGCPVKRIVMLAPANFGSPLAHRGKSFLGALFKGRWKIGDFLEVGRRLLDGLELGSPFQWDLASRDLIVEKPYFNAEQIQVTILVGLDDYAGIRGWVNKPGTDGTVVIAGTSIDSAKLQLDFSKSKDGTRPFQWSLNEAVSEFAFGVLPGLDHGSIVGRFADATSPTGGLVLKALRANTAAQFRTFVKEVAAVTDATYLAYQQAGNYRPRYQQFVFRAVDDFGVAIPDFTVEFFVTHRSRATVAGTVNDGRKLKAKEDFWSRELNHAMTFEFHTHSADPSHRRILVDPGWVTGKLADAAKDMGVDVVLSMRIYVPDVCDQIGYDVASLQNIILLDPTDPKKQPMSFFYGNTTTLVELRVNRRSSLVRVDTRPWQRP